MSSRSRVKKTAADVIDWEAVSLQDDECRAERGFKLKDKLKEEKFEESRETMVEMMSGRELSVQYMQHSGFTKPILVSRRDDLGLKIPHKEFSVDGIRSAVGSRRILNVLDARTQKSKPMCMKEWNKYWDSEPREEILNGVSLEFSKTRLDKQVTAPRVVRQVDWIDKAWPRHLKELQEDASNNLEEMMYPKVQKFVLMSVANSFMDFHLCFGGTSMWYYLLRGHKVFWLVPPTDKNLLMYESWVQKEDRKGFFGDMAEGCCRLDIPAGATMFLPAGWIHAVFTAKDSVVFSGSFLHSFNIEKQLKVSYVEETLGTMERYRFPFHTELLWYVLDRYVTCLTGKSHLDLPEEEKRRMRLEKGENIDPNKEFVNPGLSDEAPKVPTEHVNLTQSELHGLKYIVMYLQTRSREDMEVPVIIPNPVSLVASVREIVMTHLDDCPESAVTGKYVLRWTEDDDVDEDGKSKKIIPKPSDYSNKEAENPFQRKYLKAMSAKKKQEGHKRGMEAPKRRRARCGACEGCKEVDCKTCQACRDMPKHGGAGKVKQSCVRRKCSLPSLPVAAACAVCGLDGWGAEPDHRRQPQPDMRSGLYECLLCFDIVHMQCVNQEQRGQGEVLSRLPNSWECGKCVGAKQ